MGPAIFAGPGLGIGMARGGVAFCALAGIAWVLDAGSVFAPEVAAIDAGECERAAERSKINGIRDKIALRHRHTAGIVSRNAGAGVLNGQVSGNGALTVIEVDTKGGAGDGRIEELISSLIREPDCGTAAIDDYSVQ